MIAPTTTTSTISVSTDKSSYTIGDTIVISSTVNPVVPGTLMTIQIFDSKNNSIQIAQINVSSDGKFTKSFLATGPLWTNSGTFTVRVQYGIQNVTAQTTFYFNAQLAPISNVINVQDPNSQQNFGVSYTITGGSLRYIRIDTQATSLLVSINATTDGTITLQIPRALIDAKTSSGQDQDFSVLIDSARVTPQSQTGDSNSRTLTIPFLQGDQDVEVIGTILLNQSLKIPPPPTGVIIMTQGSGSSSQNCVQSNNCFSPKTWNTEIGNTVTWFNYDTVAHTVTSGYTTDTTAGELFDSSLIIPGKYFSYTFQHNGTYPYFDEAHKWMTGVVIVGNGLVSQSTSQSTLPTTNPTTPISPTTAQNTNLPIVTLHSTTKIPAWIKNIFIWYGRGSISDDELIGALQFLIQQGIIVIK